MNRYLYIYKRLLYLNISGMVAYRFSFINNLLSSVIWASFTIATTLLITIRTSSIFGWSREELLLLTANYTIMWGLFNTFVSRSFSDFPHIIDEGRLDIFLLKPINAQFLVSVNKINLIAAVRIVIGGILLTSIKNQLQLNFTPQILLGYIFLLILGMLIMYSSWFMVSTLLIWFDRLSNLISLMYNVTSMANRPTEMYLKISTFIIYLLPIVLIAVIPTKYLLHKATANEITLFIILTFIMFISCVALWRYALRFYTSVSS